MNAVERALAGAGSLEALARRPTPLGGVDARVKVVVTLAFVVATASFDRHDLSRPLPLFVLLAAALGLGDVPLGAVATRVVVALPFAVAAGLGTAAFERGAPLEVAGVAVSAGVVTGTSILMRTMLAVGAVTILVASTGFDRVCAALGRLGWPRALTTQLLLLYRFGFVVGAEAARMLRAHALRAPAHPLPAIAAAPSLLGLLLLRSLGRAERVHAAMLCRGFTGELPLAASARIGTGNAAGGLAVLLLLAVVRAVDLPALFAEQLL